MQNFTAPITNVAIADASVNNAPQSNANASANSKDRGEFERLVSRAAALEAKARDAKARDTKSEDTKPVEVKDRSESPAVPVRDVAKHEQNKTSDKNPSDNPQNESDEKPADKVFATTTGALLDKNTDDSLKEISAFPVGGSITPDVTAILPDASSVQTAGDTNLLTASTQMGLLALAAQMEKALAAMEAQKLAAANQKTPVNTLAMLSSPISAVVTEDAPELLGDVTPLVDVLGAELPGQVKPQTVTLPTNNADAIINAVKQVAQPIINPDQLQLNISAEEVIDPVYALQQVTKGNEVSKAIQNLLAQGGEPEGKKTNEALLASLKDVLSQRADKDAAVPLGQVVSGAIHAALDVGDLGKDDSSLLNQGGNQQVMSQLAADALRHANSAQRSDATFSNMLNKTTNHVPVADQVLVNIKQAVADGASHIKIQLHPEDLGRVDVRMSVGLDGKTGMTIMADNKDTLEMLQREVRHLERALTDLGLKPDAGGLSFHLRQQNQDQKFTRQQTGYAAVAEVEADEVPVMTNMAAYRLSVNEGVDIKV